MVGTYRELEDSETAVPDGVALVHIDLLDAPAVSRLIAEARPDLVLHLAAQSSVSASWGDPMRTLRDNATMQYNLLEAVLQTDDSTRVLVVGSCDEYGNVSPDDNPVGEWQELRPISPYAISKVVQDLMGYEYAAVHGLPVVRVRPFLQIGPRRSDRFVAGSFARQVAEIERGMRAPVIEVGNIDLMRDFTDVRDVARAYAATAEQGEPGEVYNIASGTAHSLRNLLDAMLHAASLDADIQQVPGLKRPGEPPILVGDASRLRDLTDWTPEISFEQSAADTLAYWRERVGQRVATKGEMQ